MKESDYHPMQAKRNCCMTSCIHSKQSIIKKDIIDVVITVIDLPYILSSLNTIFYAFAEDSPTNQIISDIIIKSISDTNTNTIKPGKHIPHTNILAFDSTESNACQKSN